MNGKVTIVGEHERRHRARYSVFEERYFDCPKCEALLSDRGAGENYDVIEGDDDSSFDEGEVIKCGNCGAMIKIEGEER